MRPEGESSTGAAFPYSFPDFRLYFWFYIVDSPFRGLFWIFGEARFIYFPGLLTPLPS